MADKEINTIEMTNVVRFRSVFSKVFCQQVCSEVLDYKQKSSPLPNSNRDCWMGRPHKHGALSLDLQTQIADKIMECVREYETTMIQPRNFENLDTSLFIKNKYHFDAWFNVNETGSWNHIHSHPQNYLSGVIWFQAKDTGTIEFMPLNYLHKLSHNIWPYHGTSVYEPKDGDILIFPSYLLHQINTNHSHKQRISMAFDVKPEEISLYD